MTYPMLRHLKQVEIDARNHFRAIRAIKGSWGTQRYEASERDLALAEAEFANALDAYEKEHGSRPF